MAGNIFCERILVQVYLWKICIDRVSRREGSITVYVCVCICVSVSKIHIDLRGKLAFPPNEYCNSVTLTVLTEWKPVSLIAFCSLLLFPFLLCTLIYLCWGIKFFLGCANFWKSEDSFLIASCEIFGWLLNIRIRLLCQLFFCMTVYRCGVLTVLAEEGWASHVSHPQRTCESHEWGSWKTHFDLDLIAAGSLCSDSVCCSSKS